MVRVAVALCGGLIRMNGNGRLCCRVRHDHRQRLWDCGMRRDRHGRLARGDNWRRVRGPSSGCRLARLASFTTHETLMHCTDLVVQASIQASVPTDLHILSANVIRRLGIAAAEKMVRCTIFEARKRRFIGRGLRIRRPRELNRGLGGC